MGLGNLTSYLYDSRDSPTTAIAEESDLVRCRHPVIASTSAVGDVDIVRHVLRHWLPSTSSSRIRCLLADTSIVSLMFSLDDWSILLDYHPVGVR